MHTSVLYNSVCHEVASEAYMTALLAQLTNTHLIIQDQYPAYCDLSGQDLSCCINGSNIKQRQYTWSGLQGCGAVATDSAGQDISSSLIVVDVTPCGGDTCPACDVTFAAAGLCPPGSYLYLYRSSVLHMRDA